MTNTEIETQASRIRSRWLAIRDGQRTAVSADSAKLTTESFVAKGPLDVAHLAALTLDQWGPHWLVKTKEQRRTRARLLKYMRNPDPSGMMSPPDESWAENRDLAEQFEQQLKNRGGHAPDAVLNCRR
jgi:hypothetical protein